MGNMTKRDIQQMNSNAWHKGVNNKLSEDVKEHFSKTHNPLHGAYVLVDSLVREKNLT